MSLCSCVHTNRYHSQLMQAPAGVPMSVHSHVPGHTQLPCLSVCTGTVAAPSHSGYTHVHLVAHVCLPRHMLYNLPQVPTQTLRPLVQWWGKRLLEAWSCSQGAHVS